MLVLLAAALAGCKPEYTEYSGGSWVMFADTLTVCPVPEPLAGEYSEPFSIPVVATQTADHDRNFAVEIVMEDLTKQGAQENAIFGKHYRLVSNTVTIPADKNTAEVKIMGRYDNIDKDKEPVLKLRLLPENNAPEWVVGRETKVRLKKSCPFDINDFTGYCLVISPYLANHPYLRQNPRLIKTEKVAGEDNALWLREFFTEGYDIKVYLDTTEPLEPKISIFEGGAKAQVLGETRLMELGVIGDGRVMVTDYPGMTSTLDACHKTARMFLRMTVGNYLPGGQDALYATDVVMLEWISDAEAQDFL